MTTLFLSKHIHSHDSYLSGPFRVSYELKKILEEDKHNGTIFIDSKNQLFDFMWIALKQRSRIDCVHIGESSVWSLICTFLSYILNIPITNTVHDYGFLQLKYEHKTFLWRAVVHWLILSLADILIPVSQTMLLLLPKKFHYKSVTIPIGCSLIKNSNLQNQNIVCLPIKSNKQPFRIITAGGSLPRKGAWYLISALEKIQVSDIELWIFGQQGNDYEKIISHKGHVKVELKGIISQSSLFNVYRSSNLFVQASLFESFGMAPLEALCCGVPIIITESCGLADYLEKFSRKYPWAVTIVRSGDADALIKAVIKIYKLYKDRKASLNKNYCFDLSELSFLSWKSVSNQYISLWSQMAIRKARVGE